MTQPNILVVLSDQQRPDSCGVFGQRMQVTPRLDALAAEGVAFDEAFTVQPVCGPSRAVMQTGLYPTGHEAGVQIDATRPRVGVEHVDHEADERHERPGDHQDPDRSFGLEGILVADCDDVAVVVVHEEPSAALAFDGDDAVTIRHTEVDDVADADAEWPR